MRGLDEQYGLRMSTCLCCLQMLLLALLLFR
jgi:hypothetical protein